MPERNRRLRLLASFLALRMSRTQQVCGRTGIEMLSGIFTLEHLLCGGIHRSEGWWLLTVGSGCLKPTKGGRR